MNYELITEMTNALVTNKLINNQLIDQSVGKLINKQSND